MILLRKFTSIGYPLRRFLVSSTSSLKTVCTNDQIRKFRSEMFTNERERQASMLRRIEKIKVVVDDPLANQDSDSAPTYSTTLMMNQNSSTPFHCALHLSEVLCDRSVLTFVDGQPWDMHRSLVSDCSMEFVHFMSDSHDKLQSVNRAYWRSCSMVLGYILETCFSNKYPVELCSFPPPNLTSGSFVYDCRLSIPEWVPNQRELRCMSIRAYEIRDECLDFECLNVRRDFAESMFQHNQCKLAQIKEMCSSEDGRVSLYRIGDFVDISQGPMISNTQQLGRFEICSIHNIDSKSYGRLQRVQGVSIPAQLRLHYWTFDLLMKRAERLNPAKLPSLKNPIIS
ncbi:hypothetical protein ACOME3_003540 [Neoechinorhynchus agilis]